jgi:ABC-type polysaccharide/polyol phosphate export permease
MSLKIHLEQNFKPWLGASFGSYELLVKKVSKYISRKDFKIQFDSQSMKTVNSIFFWIDSKILFLCAETLVSAIVFFNRAIAGSKFGKVLVFVPTLSSGIYYLFIILFTSNFNYSLSIRDQLLILAAWSSIENIATKGGLSLKYEKGLYEFGKISLIAIELGACLFGFILSIPLVIIALVTSIIYPSSSLANSFLTFLICIFLSGVVGVLVGLALSRVTTWRDAKFILPILFKFLFLFTPIFNRQTDSPGPLIYFSELNLLNLPFFAGQVGYQTTLNSWWLRILICIVESILILCLIRIFRRTHVVPSRSMRAYSGRAS